MTKQNKEKQTLWFDELSTTQAADAARQGKVVIFPVGSVEEHGVHLPLCTDSVQPEYVALEVAKQTGCLVAPSFSIRHLERWTQLRWKLNHSIQHALQRS
jgi:creatinine amidohydrolase/Fe(II)-dependent formamide hydrolase-like protein